VVAARPARRAVGLADALLGEPGLVERHRFEAERPLIGQQGPGRVGGGAVAAFQLARRRLISLARSGVRARSSGKPIARSRSSREKGQGVTLTPGVSRPPHWQPVTEPYRGAPSPVNPLR